MISGTIPASDATPGTTPGGSPGSTPAPGGTPGTAPEEAPASTPAAGDTRGDGEALAGLAGGLAAQQAGESGESHEPEGTAATEEGNRDPQSGDQPPAEEGYEHKWLPIQDVSRGTGTLWAPPTSTPTDDLLRGESRPVENGDLPRFGVDPPLARMLQNKLAEMDPGAEIEIKPGSEEAMDQRMNGAIGKMEWVKPKSAKEDEWMVGVGARGNEGLSTLAQPKLLERPEGMSDDEWADREAVKPANMSDEEWAAKAPQLQKFIDQRSAEYDHYKDAIDRAGTEPVKAWYQGQQVDGLVKASDGTQGFWGVGGYQKLGPGVLYLANPEDGKMIAPLSGDVDGFTMRNPAWGDAGTPEYKEKEAQFWDELGRDSGGIFQHEGNTPAWNPGTEDLQNIRTDILREYAENNPNGKNILRITPDSMYTARGPAIGDDGSVLSGPYATPPKSADTP